VVNGTASCVCEITFSCSRGGHSTVDRRHGTLRQFPPPSPPRRLQEIRTFTRSCLPARGTQLLILGSVSLEAISLGLFLFMRLSFRDCPPPPPPPPHLILLDDQGKPEFAPLCPLVVPPPHASPSPPIPMRIIPPNLFSPLPKLWDAGQLITIFSNRLPWIGSYYSSHSPLFSMLEAFLSSSPSTRPDHGPGDYQRSSTAAVPTLGFLYASFHSQLFFPPVSRKGPP